MADPTCSDEMREMVDALRDAARGMGRHHHGAKEWEAESRAALLSAISKRESELAAYREVVRRLNPAQLHNIAHVMEGDADREYGKSRETIQELRAVAGQLHGVALALAATPTTEGTSGS